MSFALALRLFPAATASARFSAAVPVALSAAAAAFVVLSPLRLFRLEAALPAVIAAVALVRATLDRDGEVRARLVGDLRVGACAFRELGWFRWLALACTIPVAARVARGLVAPPLGWDSLTYHLFRAGRWVQHGGMTSTGGPDAAGYYDYFAPYGDVLWAWAMLPVHGDALLALAGAAVWAAILLGAYASARAIGAGVRFAAIAALAVASTPAVATFTVSGYVDSVTLAAFLLGTAPLLRALRSGSSSDLLVAALAFGFAAATKQTAIPLLLVAAAFGAMASARSAEHRPWMGYSRALAAAIVVAAPPYLRALLERGNPLYPLALGTWLQGNPELVMVQSGPGAINLSRVLGAMFGAIPPPLHDHLGFGPGALAVVALGAVGAATLVRSGRGRECSFLLASASASLAVTLLPSSSELWNSWAYASVRLVTPALAAIAVLATAWERPATRAALATAAALATVLALPRGWGAVDVEALRGAWPALAVAVGTAVATAIAQRRGVGVAFAVALAGASVSLATLSEVRAASRYRYYASAADQRVFDLHLLEPASASMWPAWAALDGTKPRRIAFVAGFDGIGHNWYRYPLLGSHLQNVVEYVPPTSCGDTVDYALLESPELLLPGWQLDWRAWLRRLADSEITNVVIGPPAPPEWTWVVRAPEMFPVVACGYGAGGCAFGFDSIRSRAGLVYRVDPHDTGVPSQAASTPTGAPPP